MTVAFVFYCFYGSANRDKTSRDILDMNSSRVTHGLLRGCIQEVPRGKHMCSCGNIQGAFGVHIRGCSQGFIPLEKNAILLSSTMNTGCRA